MYLRGILQVLLVDLGLVDCLVGLLVCTCGVWLGLFVFSLVLLWVCGFNFVWVCWFSCCLVLLLILRVFGYGWCPGWSWLF